MSENKSRSKEYVYIGGVRWKRRKYVVTIEGARVYRLKVWCISATDALTYGSRKLMALSSDKDESMLLSKLELENGTMVWNYIDQWVGV